MLARVKLDCSCVGGNETCNEALLSEMIAEVHDVKYVAGSLALIFPLITISDEDTVAEQVAHGIPISCMKVSIVR